MTVLNEESKNLHETFLKNRSQKFNDTSCFLCGKDFSLNSTELTREHVFPKWLLRNLKLWDSSVTQIDGRLLRYRQLTVPCCKACNSGDLSRIESRVQSAYELGLKSFSKLDRRDLFLWLGKIYYGLIYRESKQPQYAREPQGPRLVPIEHLEQFNFHHFLLQSAGNLVRWEPEFPGPASFHFFECIESERDEMQFDYMDDLFLPIIGIRMGRIGVVAVLQDWGRSEGLKEPRIKAASQISLHPTQFREVYARISYITHANWNNLDHLVTGKNGTATVHTPRIGNFFGTWDWNDFAPRLASAWAVPVEAIFDGSKGMSTLGSQGGEPIEVNSMDVVFIGAFSGKGLWPYANQEIGQF